MSDVLGKKVTASGAVTSVRSRAKGVQVLGGAGAGTLNLRDGSVSGTIRYAVDVGSGQGRDIYFHGDGIYFETSIYAELTGTAAPASVTVLVG